MYLRKLGRKHYLFHSYRDGRGKVGQRRIADLGDAVSMGHHLRAENWSKLQAQIAARCPDLKPDWSRLREEALGYVSSLTPSEDKDDRMRLIREACQELKRLLRGRDEETWLMVARELRLEEEPDKHLAEGEKLLGTGELEPAVKAFTQALEQARRQLPLARKKFDPGETEPRTYLQALDGLSQALKRQQRFQAAQEVMAERVGRCPTTESREELGKLLLFCHKPEAALEQFRLMPKRQTARFFNEGAALFETGRYDEAIHPMMIGLARQAKTTDHLKIRRKTLETFPRDSYWGRNEELWTEGALRFLIVLGSDMRMRFAVRKAQGKRVRAVMCPMARTRLLGDVLSQWREGEGKPVLGLARLR